jgi:signal transduction histidine kinase
VRDVSKSPPHERTRAARPPAPSAALPRRFTAPLASKKLDPHLRACMADPDLLLIAIENVLRNAHEALGDKGQIEVCTRQVENMVTITIADHGPGIDPRTRERVFDDFFTTKGTGSGLGLSFVRRVMEAHGGQVSLDSAIGKGTRVTLELPALE